MHHRRARVRSGVGRWERMTVPTALTCMGSTSAVLSRVCFEANRPRMRGFDAMSLRHMLAQPTAPACVGSTR